MIFTINTRILDGLDHELGAQGIVENQICRFRIFLQVS